MKYDLGKKLLKELTERGRVCTVAIPLPSAIQTDAEMMAHLRDVLAINHDWIQSAYITTLDVIPTCGNPETLSGILGDIVSGDTETAGNLVVEVSVALVDLCAVDRPRGRTKTRWPAAVTIDGRRYPAAVEIGRDHAEG